MKKSRVERGRLGELEREKERLKDTLKRVERGWEECR